MAGPRTLLLPLFLALAGLAHAAVNPVEPYRHGVAGASRHVEGAVLTVGHAVLTFTGDFAPILVDGRPLGLFLQGRGNLVYTSAYRDEAPVFTRNLSEWTPARARPVEQGVAADIAFVDARVYWAGLPFPAWAGDAGAALEGGLSAHDKDFGILDEPDPWQLVALQQADNPAAPCVLMELGNGSSRWVYTLDGFEGRTECLAWAEPWERVHEPGGFHLERIPLSTQPVGLDPRRDLPTITHQVRDLDVDLRTEDNVFATLVVKERLATGVAGHRLIRFALLGDYVGRHHVHHARVARILDGAGRELAFDHSRDSLVVQLAAPSQPGTPIDLRFEYGGDFLLRPGDDNYFELAVGLPWYPMLGNPARENATFHGTVRTAGTWIGFMPGEVVRREKDGALNLLETRSAHPISNVPILGGSYFLEEETRDGLTVRVASYGGRLGVARKVIMDQAFTVIGYYKPFLGPFPWKEYTIVERNDWGYGQAPAGMMYITKEAFSQVRHIQDAERLAGTLEAGKTVKVMDVRQIFAHEIAHQYWGTVVKAPWEEDQWLEEAFAQYCAALYDRDYKAKSYYAGAVGAFFAKGADSAREAPIPLANRLFFKDPFLRWNHRRDLLYFKGPALLYALHQELGDEVFLTWLKSIQSNFRWNFAPTRRIFDLLNFITKKDYGPFLNLYYWGLEMPPRK